MPVMLHDHDIAFGAHTRVDDGDVHCTLRKVPIWPGDPEARLRRPVRRNFVGEVNDASIVEARKDDALHHGNKRAFVAKIGGDRDDAAGLESIHADTSWRKRSRW